MSAARRLVTYAGVVAAGFTGGYVIAGAVVPDTVVAQWEQGVPAGPSATSPDGAGSPHGGAHQKPQ